MSWPEAAAKAGYVLNLYAAALPPDDTHHRDLVAAIMREVGTNVEGGIIANSGHWIMEEQPDATVKAIRDFLEKK